MFIVWLAALLVADASATGRIAELSRNYEVDRDALLSMSQTLDKSMPVTEVIDLIMRKVRIDSIPDSTRALLERAGIERNLYAAQSYIHGRVMMDSLRLRSEAEKSIEKAKALLEERLMDFEELRDNVVKMMNNFERTQAQLIEYERTLSPGYNLAVPPSFVDQAHTLMLALDPAIHHHETISTFVTSLTAVISVPTGTLIAEVLDMFRETFGPKVEQAFSEARAAERDLRRFHNETGDKIAQLEQDIEDIDKLRRSLS